MRLGLSRVFLTFLCSTSILSVLTGCGFGTSTLPSPTPGPAIRGQVFGGQQVLGGAVVKIYAVGSSGNGSSATDILTGPLGTSPAAYAMTDATTGAFEINSDYLCPAIPSTPIYIVATGGNPGLTPAVNNTAITLVAALGPCNGLSTATHIVINEATTAAAAWALAPFATSATSIGASSTNLVGITNAMATANQLADTSLGSSPNSAFSSYATIESAKLYSLADVLASCVNSSGTTTACSGLFTDVTPSGAAAPPSDTFAAALDVVKNPGNNVANIFKNHISASSPFPPLSAPPNDWTMSITYSTSTGPFTNFSLNAFDAESNFWGFYSNVTATETVGTLTKLNRQYTPLVSVPLQPYTDGNDYEPTGLTIDSSQNVWISSESNSNASGTVTNSKGSVLEFDASGNLLSGTPGYTSGGILHPVTIAADSNGYLWTGSSGVYDTAQGAVIRSGGDVTVLTGNGTALSPSGGFANFSDFDPGIIAFDSSHTAWFSNNISNSNANGSTTSSPYIVSVTAPTTTNPTPTVTKTPIPNPFSSTVAVDTNN